MHALLTILMPVSVLWAFTGVLLAPILLFLVPLLLLDAQGYPLLERGIAALILSLYSAIGCFWLWLFIKADIFPLEPS